jgi:putative ABC transport system permease protein
VKGLIADARHALRLYWRTPGSSFIAVGVLAVGMAFVGAFMSLYVDLVLRPYPGVEDGSRLVTIGQSDGTRFTGIPLALAERMAEEIPSVEAAVAAQPVNVPLGRDNQQVQAEIVSRGFFDGIRPQLALGRGFEQAEYDPTAEPVVVISDKYWREQFDGRSDVIGEILEFQSSGSRRIVTVNGRSEIQQDESPGPTEFRIIGVMTPEVGGFMTDDVDVWVPIDRILPLLLGGSANADQVRRQSSLLTIGRLRSGASADALLREIRARYPESTEEFQLQTGFRFDVVGGVVRDINIYRDTYRQLQLFLTGSVLLALVAAANVSLFLLARAPGRRRELAIRLSVGAPIKRLARQLATESGLLVVLSAGLGLLVSVWLVSFLRGLAFLRQAEWEQVTLLDWRVLSLVGAFLLLLTLLVSLAPILGLKRLGIAASSRQIAARATPAQRVAGTVQIAIAGTLGGAAIAFAWYLGSMVLGYPGYAVDNRYSIQFNPIIINREGGRTTIASFLSGAVDAARQREIIESLPGVSGLSLSSLVPGAQTSLNTRQLRDPGNPTQEIDYNYGTIDSNYVDVLGLRLLYGRVPEPDESGVALVNRALARRVFGRDNVAGETLEISSNSGARTPIIGVLEDLSYIHPGAAVEPLLFTVQAQQSAFNMRGIIESRLPQAELQRQLQAKIDSGELELGQLTLRPLGDIRDQLLAPDLARSLLTIGTASLVVLLAAFGFYGTQRYLVTAGRREYAIRASLGAGPTALGRLVFRRGLMLSLPGLATGALLAFIVVAWLRDGFISDDVGPGMVVLGVVVGLSCLLVIASLGPARQARRTQPAPLLRED